MTVPLTPDAPFDEVATALRERSFRADIVVHEISAPSELAPEALALAADVRPHAQGESLYGTGRLVLLHDESEPAAWDGAWRIVAFAQAPIEPEIGTDPLLTDVAWSWLVDALDSRSAPYHAASGTITKTLSTGYGSLAAQGNGAQIELRASWSPDGDFASHVDAWVELVGMLAGLPPGSDDIAVLSARRVTRG